MKVALVSLDQVWENKKANQINCQDYIEKASNTGAEIIIFPEMTLTGFSMNTALIKEKQDKSETVEFFREQARLNNIAVSFGVVFEKDSKSTNNMVVVDHAGNLLSIYTKIHPFSFSGEDNYYSGGEELVICKIDDAILGLTVCYDLRFPEIFQALSKSSNIIVTIANWPEKRVKHWNALLLARAIENQSFVIGVNRTGIDGNSFNYVKSSIVFDPSGEKQAPAFSYLELDLYDLDISKVQTTRNAFPVKNDRKIKFYKSLL